MPAIAQNAFESKQYGLRLINECHSIANYDLYAMCLSRLCLNYQQSWHAQSLLCKVDGRKRTKQKTKSRNEALYDIQGHNVWSKAAQRVSQAAATILAISILVFVASMVITTIPTVRTATLASSSNLIALKITCCQVRELIGMQLMHQAQIFDSKKDITY